MIQRLERSAPLLFVMLLSACGRGSTVTPPLPTAPPPTPSPAAVVYTDLVRTGGSGPVPAGLQPVITLAGSQPSDGGRVTFPYAEWTTHELAITFVVTVGADSEVGVSTQMLNTSGDTCVLVPIEEAPVGRVRRGEPHSFTKRVFEQLGCGFDETGTFTTQRVRLQVTITGGSDAAPWTWSGVQDFPLTLVWAGAPRSTTETAPTITGFTACVNLDHYEGPGSPHQDEVWLDCVAREPDGEALTFNVFFESENGCGTPWQCWSSSDTESARSIDQPADFLASNSLDSPAPPVRGTATCTVTDTHGHSATRSVCVSVRGQPCPQDTCRP